MRGWCDNFRRRLIACFCNALGALKVIAMPVLASGGEVDGAVGCGVGLGGCALGGGCGVCGGLVEAEIGHRGRLRRWVLLRRKGMASVATGMFGVGVLATFGTGVGPQGTSAAGVAVLFVGGGGSGGEVVLVDVAGEDFPVGLLGFVAEVGGDIVVDDDVEVGLFDLEASFLDDDAGAGGLVSGVARAFYSGLSLSR